MATHKKPVYHQHFGIAQPPFGITPNPAFFYAGNDRGQILEALLYAVLHGEGIVKVSGEVGSGKTMLCRMLESRLPQHVDVIYLANPTLARSDVAYAIAAELGLEVQDRRLDEVTRMLQAFAGSARGDRLVPCIGEDAGDGVAKLRIVVDAENGHGESVSMS